MLYDSEKAFGRRDGNPSAWQKRLAGVEIQPDQKAGCKDAVFRRKCGRLLAAIFNRIKQHLNEHVLVNARLYGMAKSERQRRRQKG